MPNQEKPFNSDALLGQTIVAFAINSMAMTSEFRGKVKNVGKNRKEQYCLEIIPKGKRKGFWVTLDKETIVLPATSEVLSDYELTQKHGGAWHGNACLNLHHAEGPEKLREILDSQQMNPFFEAKERVIFVHVKTERHDKDDNMQPLYNDGEYTGHAVVDRYREEWLENNPV